MMERKNEIISAVEKFIRGGDNRDVSLLEHILHEKFQNTQDGFFEKKGIFVISKQEYINLIETKKFGGTPRTINFENIDVMGNLAFCKVQLDSAFLQFTSVIALVSDNDGWKVISNFPKIKTK